MGGCLSSSAECLPTPVSPRLGHSAGGRGLCRHHLLGCRHPLDVIKSRMQMAGLKQRAYGGLLDCMVSSARQEDWGSSSEGSPSTVPVPFRQTLSPSSATRNTSSCPGGEPARRLRQLPSGTSAHLPRLEARLTALALSLMQRVNPLLSSPLQCSDQTGLERQCGVPGQEAWESLAHRPPQSPRLAWASRQHVLILCFLNLKVNPEPVVLVTFQPPSNPVL